MFVNGNVNVQNLKFHPWFFWNFKENDDQNVFHENMTFFKKFNNDLQEDLKTKMVYTCTCRSSESENHQIHQSSKSKMAVITVNWFWRRIVKKLNSFLKSDTRIVSGNGIYLRKIYFFVKSQRSFHKFMWPLLCLGSRPIIYQLKAVQTKTKATRTFVNVLI